MKRLFVFLIILLLLPIVVFAKANIQETVIEAIEGIKNVQVEDDLIIQNIAVTNNNIEIEFLRNDVSEIQYIPYEFKDNTFTFSTGTFTKSNDIVTELTSNKPAFYLYSILESMSTSPYEEDHYYNEIWIKNKLSNVTDKVIKDTNWGNTFGITIEEQSINNTITYKVNYHYYLDGDDPIMISIDELNEEQGFTNPNTGTFETMVFITLLIVLGLAGLTYWNPKKI